MISAGQNGILYTIYANIGKNAKLTSTKYTVSIANCVYTETSTPA